MEYESHPTPRKIETVKELTELFQQAKGLYLADFTGLNVEQANELRSHFHKEQVLFRVVKNTLLRHACKEVGYEKLISHLEGPTAIAVSRDDPVAPVRIISDFTKNLEKKTPVLKAGILENNYIESDRLETLKNIPPRDVLLAQILAGIQAPMANFVGVLNEILRSFVAVLQAVIEKKQAEGDTPPAEAKEQDNQ